MIGRRARGGGRRRGFTLPEMIVTALLISLVAMIGAPLFMHGSRFYLLNRTRVELQRQARETLSHVTRSLRQAISSTIVIDRETNQPFYSRISFDRIDGKSVVFAQNGKQLVETVNGVTRTLADDLRFMTFFFPRSDDMTIISVSLTLEKGIYEGRRKALHVASEKVRVMD